MGTPLDRRNRSLLFLQKSKSASNLTGKKSYLSKKTKTKTRTTFRQQLSHSPTHSHSPNSLGMVIATNDDEDDDEDFDIIPILHRTISDLSNNSKRNSTLYFGSNNNNNNNNLNNSNRTATTTATTTTIASLNKDEEKSQIANKDLTILIVDSLQSNYKSIRLCISPMLKSCNYSQTGSEGLERIRNSLEYSTRNIDILYHMIFVAFSLSDMSAETFVKSARKIGYNGSIIWILSTNQIEDTEFLMKNEIKYFITTPFTIISITKVIEAILLRNISVSSLSRKYIEIIEKAEGKVQGKVEVEDEKVDHVIQFPKHENIPPKDKDIGESKENYTFPNQLQLQRQQRDVNKLKKMRKGMLERSVTRMHVEGSDISSREDSVVQVINNDDNDNDDNNDIGNNDNNVIEIIEDNQNDNAAVAFVPFSYSPVIEKTGSNGSSSSARLNSPMSIKQSSMSALVINKDSDSEISLRTTSGMNTPKQFDGSEGNGHELKCITTADVKKLSSPSKIEYFLKSNMLMIVRLSQVNTQCVETQHLRPLESGHTPQPGYTAINLYLSQYTVVTSGPSSSSVMHSTVVVGNEVYWLHNKQISPRPLYDWPTHVRFSPFIRAPTHSQIAIMVLENRTEHLALQKLPVKILNAAGSRYSKAKVIYGHNWVNSTTQLSQAQRPKPKPSQANPLQRPPTQSYTPTPILAVATPTFLYNHQQTQAQPTIHHPSRINSNNVRPVKRNTHHSRLSPTSTRNHSRRINFGLLQA
eukprot:gene5644-11384_t